MPDEDDLRGMYGEGYAAGFTRDPNIDDPKEPERVLEWLGRLGGGTFLDYGCGDGALLARVSGLGWRLLGVEFDARVAEAAGGRSGAVVVADSSLLLEPERPPADVVYLGDVIEHLTDLDRQFPRVLGLLKPGGWLIAQGPLEASPNLFTWALRQARSWRRSPVEAPPYHVLLATAGGQRLLFSRHGLEEVEYTLTEVAWPAPSRLSLADLSRPRAVVLFALRKLSQGLSRVRRGRLGNRYFYVGRKPASGRDKGGGAA
jgi:SAM-dependent methyltransferase